jgi:CubicO group peptidase (beta-lactamase class C family)
VIGDALNTKANPEEDATAGQEQRFAAAFAILNSAIVQRAFPGASLAVTLQQKLVAHQDFGRFTYLPASLEITPETLWDLASLTKPLATTSMAMLLYERGKLSLDCNIIEFLPEFAAEEAPQKAWREAVTVRMLLAHSAGLPAHRKLYLETSGRAAIIQAAMRLPLDRPPMTRAEYSDIGFILLGELLERIANEPLDVFCDREIFNPLKLRIMYSPQQSATKDVPPTTNDLLYRGRAVQGEVNDENASAMGGVAGHAGLFGDALSVSRFARCLLRGGAPIFQAETVRLFTSREPLPAGTSRALGWDTPSAPSQSGMLFSARSFGHLGYTGTSLWCDPERALSITLLTNRTWPDASNQAIKQVRPKLHDAVVRALDAP